MHGTLVPARALTSSTRSESEVPAGTRRHTRGARVAVRAGGPVEIVADTLFATTTRSLTEGQRAGDAPGRRVVGEKGNSPFETLGRGLPGLDAATPRAIHGSAPATSQQTRRERAVQLTSNRFVLATLLVALGTPLPATAVDQCSDFVGSAGFPCRLTTCTTGTAVQVS